MFQIKAKDKSSEQVQNEVEVHNLLDIEFKEMIIKILNELRRIMNKQSMLAELVNIKNNQGIHKWNKKKYNSRINSRLDNIEKWTNELEDRVVEITQTKQEKKKLTK